LAPARADHDAGGSASAKVTPPIAAMLTMIGAPSVGRVIPAAAASMLTAMASVMSVPAAGRFFLAGVARFAGRVLLEALPPASCRRRRRAARTPTQWSMLSIRPAKMRLSAPADQRRNRLRDAESCAYDKRCAPRDVCA